MEENMNRSIVYNNIYKKRKLQGQQLMGTPPRKHVCWDHMLECDSASDSTMGQKKQKCAISPRQIEPDQESAKDSNSFWGGNTETESSSYSCNSTYPKAHKCYEPSSSSANWGECNSSEIDLCSSDRRSFENQNSSKSQPMAISSDNEDLHNDYGLHVTDHYEDDHLQEFQRHGDYYYCLECKTNDGFQHCKDLDDLLYSSDLAPRDYAHSSGRSPIDEGADTQLHGTRKLTIDKEFEQYFSSLML